MGNSPRRCVVNGLIKGLDVRKMFTESCRLGPKELSAYYALLGSLIGDELFREHWAMHVVPKWPEILAMHFKVARLKTALVDRRPLLNSRELIRFSGHAFAPAARRSIIGVVNWADIALDSLREVFRFCLSRVGGWQYFERALGWLVMERLADLESAGMTAPAYTESFVVRLCELILKCEVVNLVARDISTSASDGPGRDAVRYKMDALLFRILTRIVHFVSPVPLRCLVEILPTVLADLDPKYRGAAELFDRSPAEENVQFDVCFALHLLAFHCARSDFMRICRSVTGDCESLWREWLLFPLRV
jgi:hypothetical protein